MTMETLRELGPAVANHLWQSTAFAAVAWLLTLLLRKNAARVRYGVWLAASVKFLVPFSLLIALGGMLPKPRREVVSTPVSSTADELAQPFTQALPLTAAAPVSIAAPRPWVPLAVAGVWLGGTFAVLLVWAGGWRQVRRMMRNSRAENDGREVAALRRVEAAMGWRGRRVRLRLTTGRMEPGMTGLLRPVLVWPDLLSERLDDAHIEAILAHELMHARRRDNLTAVLHMAVEAVFWFHPLVWWMERRMVEERERACDEGVVQAGRNAETYAESLLEACRFCVEPPLMCVPGITGADLNRRVRSILTLRITKLGVAGKAMLVTLGLVVVAGPLAFGIVRTIPIYGQILKASGARPSFEVASIHLWKRPAPPPEMVGGEQVIHQQTVKFSPGNEGGQTTDLVHIITPLGVLIAQAYGLPPGSDGRGDGRILGGPNWVTQDDEQYDIHAKIGEQEYAAIQKMTAAQQREQVNLMKQSLLADRFKLKVHFETRELPAYALLVAKGGPKLTAAKDGESTKLSSTRRGQTREMSATGTTLAQFAESPLLSGGTSNRTVLDQTGLKGRYDFTLTWGPEYMAAGQERSDEPALFTAIQEQLGLKLVPTKGPVEVIVIDHIEKPSVDGAEVPASNPPAPETPRAQAAPADAPAKPMAFEVVSIRKTVGDEPRKMEVLPDGWHMTNMAITVPILLAYVPKSSEGSYFPNSDLLGLPSWAMQDRYDITAKVAPADLVDWQNPAKQPAMMHAMAQALMAERCNLQVHRSTRTQQVLALEVAKDGPRFKPTDPSERLPEGMKIPGGGLVVPQNDGHTLKLYNAPMSLVVSILSKGGTIPIEDRTGLKGRYDLVLNRPEIPRQPGEASDPADSIDGVVKEVGLKVTPVKSEVETLVVDHIDRPTDN